MKRRFSSARSQRRYGGRRGGFVANLAAAVNGFKRAHRERRRARWERQRRTLEPSTWAQGGFGMPLMNLRRAHRGGQGARWERQRRMLGPSTWAQGGLVMPPRKLQRARRAGQGACLEPPTCAPRPSRMRTESSKVRTIDLQRCAYDASVRGPAAPSCATTA